MAYPRGGMAVKDLSFRIAKGEFAFLTAFPSVT
jgi:ABC-type ATPase involved in cell division